MTLAARISQPPRFQAGRFLMTAGVNTLVEQGRLNFLQYLTRHLSGDWGDVCPEEAASNQAALRAGNQLRSSYQVTPDIEVWIITESDRSATRMLLTDELIPH